MSSNEANDCCMGYFILSAQRCGLDEDDIEKVLRCFYSVFDEYTVDEAIEVYKNFNF